MSKRNVCIIILILVSFLYSFVSNSKQDLGKYATVEMSNSQGTKVKGHLFPETVDSSEMDLFKGEEEGKNKMVSVNQINLTFIFLCS